jgi:hypothetical protein
VAETRTARATLKIFERLYELHGQIEREAERVELVLETEYSTAAPRGGVHHPLVLQRLQLELDAQVPEFTLRETEHPVELYSALFRSMRTLMDEQSRSVVRNSNKAATTRWTATPLGFLRRLVCCYPLKESSPRRRLYGEIDHPRIGRDAVIFMRTRTWVRHRP